ncbi:uncharacterized protein [Oscarella lobularis]|uniref:uncharacterized protein isoform X1 n=1 Tax=Oscarella lobularis TaxID=121494 RepID=UPI00331336A6
MPELTKANNGKGRPVEYELSPLSRQISSDIQSTSDATNRRIGQVFDELGEKKELVWDTWKDVDAVSDVLDADVVRKFKEFCDEIEIAEVKLKEALKAAVLSVRSKKTGDEKPIQAELDNFEKSPPCSHENIQSFLDEWKPKVQGKIDAYLHLRQLDVPFLQKNESLRNAIDNSDGDLYVLFSGSDFQSDDTRSLFLSYKKRKAPEAKYLMVDFDLHPDVKQSPMGTWYRNGEVQCVDCTNDFRFACLVKPINVEEKYSSKDWEKTFSPPLRIHCPRALLPEQTEGLDIQPDGKQESIKECPNNEVTWRCFLCHKEVVVGIGRLGYRFDYIFCDCGSVEIDKCGFKCNDPAHGDKFVQFGENREKIIRNFVAKSN